MAVAFWAGLAALTFVVLLLGIWDRVLELTPKKPKPGAAGLTNAIGGMLVGLDEQLLRSQPRAEILVKRGTQLRIERDAGGELVLEMPEPLEPPTEELREG